MALACACGGRTTPSVLPTSTTTEATVERDESRSAATPPPPSEAAGSNAAPATALPLANAKNLTRYDDEFALDPTPATITRAALASEQSGAVGPYAIARLPVGWRVRVLAKRPTSPTLPSEGLLVAWQEDPGSNRWLGGWILDENVEPVPPWAEGRRARPKKCRPGTLPFDGACAKQCFAPSDCHSGYCVPNGPPRTPFGSADSVCLEHRGDEDVDPSLSTPKKGACPAGKVLAVGGEGNAAGYLICAKPYRQSDQCLGARDLLLPDRVGRVRVEFLCPGDR